MKLTCSQFVQAKIAYRSIIDLTSWQSAFSSKTSMIHPSAESFSNFSPTNSISAKNSSNSTFTLRFSLTKIMKLSKSKSIKNHRRIPPNPYFQKLHLQSHLITKHNDASPRKIYALAAATISAAQEKSIAQNDGSKSLVINSRKRNIQL